MCRVQAQASGILQSGTEGENGNVTDANVARENWQKDRDDSAQKGPRLNQTLKLVIRWLPPVTPHYSSLEMVSKHWNDNISEKWD